MTPMKYWLWLTTRTELSLNGMYWVLDCFGSPEAAYYAAPEDYRQLPMLKPAAVSSLQDKSMERAERILADCDRLDVRICTLQDADYPQRLRQISYPPLVLYFRGKQLRFDEEVAIAVAGTRSCSEYGRDMARKLAWQITKNGGLVVTGVVPGCDYAAVQGALQAGGPVACVLAGGVDVPFDSHSNDLYARVMERGVLVSEYPPGREPRGKNFPQRNRILTGLCVGTLCVEGAHSSGVMLVAKNALDQNRDVFVVPTGADRPEGAGMLELMKEGAAPVTAGREILETYVARFPRRLQALAGKPEAKKAAPKQEEPPAPLQKRAAKKEVDKSQDSGYIVLRDHRAEYTETEAAILLALQEGEQTADELLAKTDVAAQAGLSALTMLTLRGLISEEEGGRFRALIRVK